MTILETPIEQYPYLISINDAAAICGVSREEIIEYINNKLDPLPSSKRGNHIRVYSRALETYMARKCEIEKAS